MGLVPGRRERYSGIAAVIVSEGKRLSHHSSLYLRRGVAFLTKKLAIFFSREKIHNRLPSSAVLVRIPFARRLLFHPSEAEPC
jgi:hypothetical protein